MNHIRNKKGIPRESEIHAVGISGLRDGNVQVDGTCSITGSVDGNVFVPSSTTLTLTGSVNGNIEGSGSGTVNLGDHAVVFGNVIHEGDRGKVDFIANGVEKSIVHGNVELKGTADLDATGSSTVNAVNDSIKCDNSVGGGSGTETDWDGDTNTDGVMFGNYEVGCP